MADRRAPSDRTLSSEPGLEAEQAPEDAHGRLLTILDGLDAVVCVADIETHEILFANLYARKVFGEELVGRACWQRFHLEQPGPCDHCNNSLLVNRHGDPTGSLRWEQRNGARDDWWDIQAQAIRWVDGRMVRLVIATDITTRKHMEMELHAREQLYRSVFENTGTATVIIEEDTMISAANAQCEALFGYTREEIEGRLRWTHFVVAEDLEKMMDFHRLRRSSTGEVPGEYEFRIRDKQGQVKDILGKVCMIPGSMRSVASLVDITDRKKSEAELLNVQRLESIAVLAGGIAHDFNNLLTVILGNISIAQIYAQPGDAVYRTLAEAEKASLRAKDLSYKLLTFSKGGTPVKKTTALQQLIRDTVALMVFKSGIRIRLDIPDEVWLVDCDSPQIGQVINNLVMNADEAMPAGGTIEISARNVLAGEEAPLPFERGEYVKIAVRDRGVGIAEEHLSRIFDPYFTTKPRGTEKGSGLGLSIVHSIVRKHGGFIVAESREREGSTLIFYLPASGSEPRQAQSEETLLAPRRERILVMDDEDSVRETIVVQLNHLGYDAVPVSDGTEALAAYQEAMESGQTFGAVIMDLTIPGGMGGKETIRRLLTLEPKARAIISSGYANDPIMRDFSAYGFRGAVEKPFQIQRLGEVLRSVLDHDAAQTF
jgi:two-component system, cell cycle sensor histidine kinase and response regulator CckA